MSTTTQQLYMAPNSLERLVPLAQALWSHPHVKEVYVDFPPDRERLPTMTIYATPPGVSAYDRSDDQFHPLRHPDDSSPTVRSGNRLINAFGLRASTCATLLTDPGRPFRIEVGSRPFPPSRDEARMQFNSQSGTFQKT